MLLSTLAHAQAVDPEIARMLERALADAENFRKQLKTSEYDANMRVQEWDGRGRLRGIATARAIVRPGDPKPMTFISRHVDGKVRLPDDKPSKNDDDKETSLQEFAREHRISERFAFDANGVDEIAGERARRITFQPKPNQAEKNSADRFLDAISGTAWISEQRNKLVKFDLKLAKPFQLFWILAVLKDLSIEYELLEPGEILGHAKVKVLFALTTPVYSIRQQHDVDISNFRPRTAVAARSE
ncbi:MAG: hypothetical protein M3032_02810 [Verrucomicrobiota bacterium]|nr:hypothetical protein [Verrucomicrobiota bacterium]